jgi:hypothetical protein
MIKSETVDPVRSKKEITGIEKIDEFNGVFFI